MSEKRRRRRRSSMGSDESEGEEEIANKSGGDGSVDGNEDRDDHDESESAADDEDESFKGSGDEADREGLYPDEAEDSNGEPEEGDEAKVDHDEDKRNPQYIPKKGMFYEHDDRVDSEEEAEAAKEEAKNKKVWKSEVVEKWGHDKFLELEQTPKSKEELIQAYGYDIRNEDNAPRARRRRRYGRGPSKYTRSWQDEEQYQKQGPVRGGAGGPAAPRGRGGQVRSERPPLRNSAERDEERRPPPRGMRESENNMRNTRGRGGRGQPVRGRGGRAEAGPPRKDPGYSANARLLNRPKPVVPADEEHMENDLNKMRLEGDGPRRSDKPKRYSSQRQRQHGQNDQFYEGQFEGGQQFGGGNGASNGPPPNAPFIPNQSSTAQRLVTQAGVPTPYINPTGMVNYGPPPVQYTVPVTAVGVTVPLSVPPLVGVAPETFPAGTMPIAGGTVTAVGAPLLAPHLSQGFPGATPAGPAVVSTHQDPVLLAGAVAAGAVAGAVPTQGGYAEVRGGVTYFNPTAQPPSIARPIVNKRPKAAIPIVDPSEIRSGSLSSDGASPQQSVDQYEQNNSASSPETSKRVMEADGDASSPPEPAETSPVVAAT